ncbi:PA2778 family cysteine peptidase [Zooshikella harenae]|uniref:PA2778 family cysteine peptidase n=1 Tax=Zooshikella harenae TaxID=2827238 RepID=A0ABS5ZEW4_9GAMM|nr:PA2778 family cysteine peptidase [Zooshikella harenae]MBU2712378.1 PA2778 family cysteine peptidase [Zooshikella harenae]
MSIKRYAQLWLGIIYLSVLSGCTTNPVLRQLDSLDESVLQPTELNQVPFFPQEEYQCGPAALATVLAYWQVPVTPNDLVSNVYVPDKQGSFQVEMVATARQYGMLAYPLNKDFQNLLQEIEQGFPILVFLNLGLDWYPQWHFAVVVGYDLANKELILRSGTEKRYRMPFETFANTWARGRYWAMAILPPNKLPASAKPLTYLRAAQQLEAVGQQQAAVQAYQTALAAWPKHPVALFAMGNYQFAVKKYPQAAGYFKQLVSTEPSHSQGWNNLAYTLKALNCPVQANKAVRCAYALAPDDNNIQSSWQELQQEGKLSKPEQVVSVGKKTVCVIPQCPVLPN